MSDTIPQVNGKPPDMTWNVYDPDGKEAAVPLSVIPGPLYRIRGGLTRVLMVETPRAEIELQVSRAGAVRVFDRKQKGWPELKPKRRKPRLPYKAGHLRARADEADQAARDAETRKDWDAVSDSLDLAAMLRCGADALEALG